MKTGHVALCLLPFVMVALLVAAFAAPPNPVGENAPADVFSAGRAMAHVRGLTSTGKPHPAAHYDGSARTPEEIADHDRARDWVMSSLRNLGLEPVIQKGNACGRFTCADVENIVARWEVGSAGPALVLMAHYDSTPFGPGAADDGAGVATLLETVRALKAGPAPKRPLIIVIDDGEEMGLLGARVLMKDHPWLNDMELFLNFEARGTSGQVAMFETSAGNGALIDTFAASVKRPVASSVIYTLYKRLPNDTDLSIVKQGGKQGLNFAFADHVYNYHTANDTETELNLGSLQHMGDQALAVSQAFLSAETLPKPTSDSAYFDLFSLVLVHYPENVSGPLALLGAILAFVGIGFAIKKKRTSIGRLALAVAVVLGSLIAGAITGVGLGALLKKVRFPNLGTGPLAMRAMMGDRHSFTPWLAIVCTGVAASLAFALWLCPRDKANNRTPDTMALSGGALFWWTVFALLLGFGAPGASHLFVWPLFGLAGAFLYLTRLNEPSPTQRTIAVIQAALPAALLWIPLVRVLLIMVGPTMPPAAVIPLALLGGLITPALVMSERRVKWALPVVGGAVGVLSAVMAMV